MLKNFTGTHDHRMDDKGRVSLPTEFRRVLDTMELPNSLYVVPGLQDPRALVFLTNKAYETLIERHNAREYPSLAAQNRAQIKLVSRASQIQVDDAGRIVISKPLREQFGLEKEVRFVGGTTHFEMWRPDAHAAYEAEIMAGEAEDPVHFDLRGLH